MCGIAGTLQPGGQACATLRQAAASMGYALRHRGPDDAGLWCDAPAGIALAHRRLAVIDLSPAARQPMESSCGRYVITFNGEIYGFQSLRAQLEHCGHRFRSSSDTEVLLAAVVEWGVRGALQRANGMFAFAVWDRGERRLYLARDCAGEKPLYYGRLGPSFAFASELKALAAHPQAALEIDRSALALYLRYGYVPAPYAIYSGIRKLPPGAMVQVDANGDASAPEPYWSAGSAADAGLAHPFRGRPEEALEALDAMLGQSVRLRAGADVPVGALLSGGIDSSLVVALMARSTSRPVRTFTIGSHQGSFDEAPYARAVARHLGTDHTELYVTPEDAAAIIPHLPRIYDEPFADSSQIPTCLVSELARRHVTVALTGDGGDELFGGYDRYSWTERAWRCAGWMPPSFRRTAAHACGAFASPAADTIAAMLPSRVRAMRAGDRLAKISELLAAPTYERLYGRMLSHWPDPGAVVIRGSEPALAAEERSPRMERFHWMMRQDLDGYLPGDILVKLDRASMSVGLEARAPFLDRNVIEFAWRLPLSYKIRGAQGKWLLRRLVRRYVPPALIDRPKAGFAIPLNAWLRGPLRSWAEVLLDEDRLRAGGYLEPAPVRRKWREHLSGRRNWAPALWTVLMFQAWLETWNSAAPEAHPHAAAPEGVAR